MTASDGTKIDGFPAGDLVLFLDLESSGLSPHDDRPLEIAAIACHPSEGYPEIGRFHQVIHHGDDVLRMQPVAAAMHATNGLTDEVRASTMNERATMGEFLAWLDIVVPDGRAHLCGFGVGSLDYPMLGEWVARCRSEGVARHYTARVSHRLLDLYCLAMLGEITRYSGGNGHHRAMGDAEDARRSLLDWQSARSLAAA